MVLAPPYFEVDGFVVRLVASPADSHPSWIAHHSGEQGSAAQVLSFVTNNLLGDPPHEVLRLIDAHQRLPLSLGISAEPIEKGRWPDSEYAEGSKAWQKETGSLPDLADSYSVGTSFLRQSLVIPRTTFFKLMKRLYELNEAVREGRMEPKIDRSIPLPLPRPEPLLVPPGSWDDEELEEFERFLRRLDELDPLVAALAEPARKLTLEALERRASVFGLLEICEARSRSGADPVHARAKAHGYAVTCAYFDAIAELRAYLASPERLEVLAGFGGGQASAPSAVEAELARPLLAVASLDLFRLPHPAHPADLTYYQWLALCEGTFRYDPLVLESLPSPREGTCGDLFTRLRRVSTRLRYRTEHGKGLRLWRAELA